MSGNSVILGTGGWTEEGSKVEDSADDAEDFVEIDNLVALVDGNTVAIPVTCIDGVTARESLEARGGRVSMRDELRVGTGLDVNDATDRAAEIVFISDTFPLRMPAATEAILVTELAAL